MHEKKAKHKFFINQALTIAICLVAEMMKIEEDGAMGTLNLCITQGIPYKASHFYAMKNGQILIAGWRGP